ESAGFTTIVRIDATRVQLYRALDEFAGRLRKDPHSVGLFYYAGHGMQVDGANYLIPVDADIQSVPDLEANAFDVGRVLHALEEAQNEMNIVILDACRNNPLPKSRGAERGLARMNAPSGTFIAYAAAPGQTAQDGRLGANGVFTGELVKAMAEPGVPLEEMYKQVIRTVKVDTHGAQQPWSESSVQGDFFFHSGAGATTAAAAPAGMAGTPPVQQAPPRPAVASPASHRAKAAPRGAAAQPPPGQDAAATRTDTRCNAILERAQIGDSLSGDDKAYLIAHCQ
ncbi:MAG TPA: caspase family protein, partial [Steroidobacteraceae bacterium]|nr:caspase family protein [Steroidobacteraceae bacterium]